MNLNRSKKRMYALFFTAAVAAALPAQAASPVLTTLYSFTDKNGDGGFPFGPVTIGNGGVLYGATSANTDFLLGGTIYSLTPPASAGGAWTESVLYVFPEISNFGTEPVANVVIDSSGTLYATTEHGGTFGEGAVISLTPPSAPGGAWTPTALYDFSLSDGAAPSYLAMGTGGVIYGIANSGGAADEGTVFSLAPPASPGGAWTYTLLYSFQGGADGALPMGIVVGPGGVLYGATEQGGGAASCKFGCGTVFSLAPPATPGNPWTETVLHAFTDTPGDGANIKGGVVVGPGGVLYGATQGGGTLTGGTVYSLTPPASPGGSWTEDILYNVNTGDAERPITVTLGSSGVLYGASREAVFALTPPASPGGAWTLKVLQDFTGSDGLLVNGGLVIGSSGKLFGTTNEGGANSDGTVFSLKP
ncbi:MAG: choice-of-anchor tandem repeat GloVer-containing protein [Bryobacteraceae bacterium]|jgi:hypothetical protein